ncbi:hypothetical protein [Variovorax paradoxus]|uniref:hypothetical protein n=1 Tax=Variovorax paradoxus TaxID=34073 RepID=UPI001ABC15B1
MPVEAVHHLSLIPISIAWELRAALDQARLWSGQGQAKDAAELLEASIGRAPPDDGNAALVEARGLLDTLAGR